MGAYRRWPYVLFRALFGSVSLFSLIFAIRAAWREGIPLDHPLGMVFAVVWRTAMLGISGLLTYRIFWMPAAYSRIDDAGITVDARRWRWDEVKWVFLKRSDNGAYLCFQRTGWGPDQAVHGWPPLELSEAEDILAALEDFLGREHPHVSIG